MLAIQAEKAGGPEVLKAVEQPVPEPGPGEVRVRNHAIGVNYIDTYHRSGLYPVTYPATLGQEGAGVIEAVGEGVARFKVGDRAAYGNGPMGGYAEAHVLPEGKVAHLPEDVGFDVAAGAMLKGMTSEYLVRRCFPLKAGQTALVWAAAGGVGSILCQWAHAIGARVVGVVGSDAKAEIARASGCDLVLNHKRDDIAAAVRDFTAGKGAEVSYDGVGKASLDASLASLARRGMLVSFGNASGPVAGLDLLRLSRGGSLYVTRPTLFDYVATVEELDDSAQALFGVIRSGAVRIEIGARRPLAEARQAHEALEASQTTGSTVLIP